MTGNTGYIRMYGFGVLVAGVLVFFYALFELNSVASQLRRALGGVDFFGIYLLIAGGLLALSGALDIAGTSGNKSARGIG